MAPGTRRPHQDSELISCYHDAVLTWGHYHNNIVLPYHDSPITRSHFMDPTDRAIRGFYCTCRYIKSVIVLLTHCSVLAYSYRFYVLSLQHGSLYMTNWWSVRIGSDNSLVREGTKPFPKSMLTKINDAIFLQSEQTVCYMYFQNIIFDH